MDPHLRPTQFILLSGYFLLHIVVLLLLYLLDQVNLVDLLVAGDIGRLVRLDHDP